MRVSSPLELAGDFWLADSPEHKINGTLHVRDSGSVELRLNDLIYRDRAKACDSEEEIPKITGKVERYGYVTLERCFHKYFPMPLGPINVYVIHAIISHFPLKT